MALKNFLPDQYERTGALKVSHNYLPRQFADHEVILAKIAEVVRRGDFTLGRSVDEFEARWADLVSVRHAIGVASGTDALLLSLKALGIGPGDEVVTTPFTFFATIGAIVTAGARPVFADVGDDFNIDPGRIEACVTPRTQAILPVHWAGNPCRMDEILGIAGQHGLHVVEDACHAILARRGGRPAGSFGIAGAFSMHPLKNINVWGDGGVVATDDGDLADRLRLLRNHGLVNRNETQEFAYNSRLDTIQAVVAMHLLDKLDHITDARIGNAAYYDAALGDVEQIAVPSRDSDVRQVFHIYCVRAERRDELVAHLVANDVDAKVHYPIPMHLQPAAREYGYRRGDFPVCEAIADSTISLPVHEFVTPEEQDYVIDLIRGFYA